MSKTPRPMPSSLQREYQSAYDVAEDFLLNIADKREEYARAILIWQRKGRGHEPHHLERLRKFIELVDEIETRLPHHLAVFLIIRRDYRHYHGTKGWTEEVDIRLREQGICRDARQTISSWWRKIVTMTMFVAAKRGLL